MGPRRRLHPASHLRDYFDAQSFRDGYDLVEWAAAQKWSTGKVGMTGISYGAINATRVKGG